MELFVREWRGVFDFGFIGIDGVDGVVEQYGYLVIIVDAETDKRENSQFGIEQFAVLRCYLLIGGEEVIELWDEIGEDMQEDGVESSVEIVSQSAHVGILWNMQEVVPSFVLCAFLDIALVFLEFAKY